MAAPTNLHRDIGRLEGKLDAVLVEMRGSLTHAHQRIDTLETWREGIDALESERRGAVKAARWLWAAITAAIGFLAGTAGRLFTHGFGAH